MYDFIAIDFETANEKMGSACSIGIAAVKDGVITDAYYSLIKPIGGDFAPRNIEIHGITPEMVADAKTLDELCPEIAHFFDEHTPVFAHNAKFDMSVLKQSSSVKLPEFWYADSMDAAAPFVHGSKSLMACAEALRVPVEHHHDALDDAKVCAGIVLCAMNRDGVSSVWEFVAKENVKVCRFSELEAAKTFADHKPSKHYHKLSPSDVSRTTEVVDENGPLFGKNIVFTGDMSIGRKDAMQIAVNCGAVVKSSVSRKTDFLVVGVQDTAVVGDDGMSGKEEKAHALNEAGADIRFLSESEFLDMVKGAVTV